MTDTSTELVNHARSARKRAHAPYSGFSVGAAIRDDHGWIHTGCNVENAALPEGICAETNAIGSMVVAGGKKIVAIAIVGGSDELADITPCGGCRQRILEFADEDTDIVLLGADGRERHFTIAELLPESFKR
jgi:cytidine deaminase